jgi:formylglycine-generating enzyme required for sulfatase activity
MSIPKLALPLALMCGALVLAQTAPSNPNQIPAGMKLIPAGEFWMGRVHFFLVDAVGWFERERQDDFPAHKVTLDAFFIDTTEVTDEQYAPFAAAKNIKKPWHWPHGEIPKGEEKFPVYNVDWNEAKAFCESQGKRLPTEAEWEKAARGGLDRKKYTWGDTETGAPETPGETGGRRGRGAQSKSPANAASKGPVAVASFPPNGYGLFDMAGNVWEWVNDWHQTNYYSISPLKNPQGPATGEYKVFRGGGWIDTDERNQMPSFRNYTDPLQKSPTIGFRCAKSIQ